MAAFCAPAFALTASEHIQGQPSNIFYNSGAQGWYWYHDPLPEEIQEPLPPPVVSEVTEPEHPDEVGESSPEPFSLKWVQKMLPKYQELAWDNPTPENVQAYFLVQRFAMDKANRFSDVAQQVVVGNALLDETMRRPLATFANTYIDRASAQNTDDLLKKIAQKAGIFFFFKSDCRYCEAQAPLIGLLENLGFSILAVSIDGGELQSYKFANTKLDSGQAQALGVSATPAMFLMSEEGQFSALGQSVISYSDLRRRILLVAAREGWVTQEELKETQPLLNPNDQHDLGEELPQLLRAAVDDPTVLVGGDDPIGIAQRLSHEEKNKLADKDNFISPDKLIALFGRSAKTTGNFQGE